ncbi:MAG: MBL fold metallo-hydrolase [Bacteriovoracales bacterium]
MAIAKVLVEGYYFRDKEGLEHASATVSLVLDKGIVMVVDPGTLKDPKILVDALKKEGLGVKDVTMVGVTHSHIDHYKNAGMFPGARILEYFGIWDEDKVESYDEHFSENIQILKTPGHDITSITFFVKTNDGVVAICGDVFWKENFPETDLYASDLQKLEHSRKLVLRMAKWVIPGHAGMYKAKSGTIKLASALFGTTDKLKARVTGRCKKCRTPFTKNKDKCFCQEWLCYHCCECEMDCNACNCKHRI